MARRHINCAEGHVTKLVLDRLFVELPSADEADARAKVEAALAALRRKAGEGFRVHAVLPDPRAGWFGVELEGHALSPPRAWGLAHRLRRKLGGDAHVEPVFAGDVAVGGGEDGGEGEKVPAPAAPAHDDSSDAPLDVRWPLARIRAEEAHAWLRERGIEPGAGVSIGHPDTGYTLHPSIWAEPSPQVAVARGANLLDPDQEPRDPRVANPKIFQVGHGTKTESIMIGRPDAMVARAGTGELVSMLGIAPAATVVPFRVSDSVFLLGWQRRLAEALEAAVEAGCHVVSMSIGGLGGARLDRAIRLAESRGVIVVAASGNGVKAVVAPANHPMSVGVAASTWEDKGWWMSSEGPAITITSPGADVWIAAWDGDRPTIERSSGTSFATASVAAAAALWRSAHAAPLAAIAPGLHPALFRAALRATARAVPDLAPRRWGGGILDCAALVARPVELDLEAARAEVAKAAAKHPDSSAPLLAAVLDDLVPDHLQELPAPIRAALDKLASLSRGLRAELAYALTVDPAARASWRQGHPWLPKPPWARIDGDADRGAADGDEEDDEEDGAAPG